jgi:hypothetical protein
MIQHWRVNVQESLRIFEDPCMLVVLPVGARSLTGLTKRGPTPNGWKSSQPTAKKESVDAQKIETIGR